MRKPQSTPVAPAGPDQGPWIDLGNGRSRSASTGRMRYDPNADPTYRDAIKRLQAKEGAAAKAADRSVVATVLGSVLAGHPIGRLGSYIG